MLVHCPSLYDRNDETGRDGTGRVGTLGSFLSVCLFVPLSLYDTKDGTERDGTSGSFLSVCLCPSVCTTETTEPDVRIISVCLSVCLSPSLSTTETTRWDVRIIYVCLSVCLTSLSVRQKRRDGTLGSFMSVCLSVPLSLNDRNDEMGR